MIVRIDFGEDGYSTLDIKGISGDQFISILRVYSDRYNNNIIDCCFEKYLEDIGISFKVFEYDLELRG